MRADYRSCRTSNVERRTPNAERRAPNAERRTSNDERRTSNLEQRTSNAERRTLWHLTPDRPIHRRGERRRAVEQIVEPRSLPLVPAGAEGEIVVFGGA